MASQHKHQIHTHTKWINITFQPNQLFCLPNGHKSNDKYDWKHTVKYSRQSNGLPLHLFASLHPIQCTMFSKPDYAIGSKYINVVECRIAWCVLRNGWELCEASNGSDSDSGGSRNGGCQFDVENGTFFCFLLSSFVYSILCICRLPWSVVLSRLLAIFMYSCKSISAIAPPICLQVYTF